MNPQEKCEKWRKLIKEFEASQENKKTWCTERKISPHVFGYWFARYGLSSQSKLRENAPVNKTTNQTVKGRNLSTSKWLEIQLPEMQASPKEIQDVCHDMKTIQVKVGKAEILLSAGFDKDLFKDVAKILGELC